MNGKPNQYGFITFLSAVEQMRLDHDSMASSSVLMGYKAPNDEVVQQQLGQFAGTDLQITDEALISARTNCSDAAHKAMSTVFDDRVNINYPDGVSRPVANLFRGGHSDEDKNFNTRVKEAVEKDDITALVQLFEEHLQSLDSFDPAQMENMSDEELVEKFPQVYALYAMAQDADALLDPDKNNGIIYHLSTEAKDKLRKLADDFSLLAVLMARMEMICHPYYAKVDLAKLMKEENLVTKAGNALNNAQKESGEALFFMLLHNYANQDFDLQLSRQLRDSGLDIPTLKIMDLNKREYKLNSTEESNCRKALQLGMPLICVDGKGNAMVYRMEGNRIVSSDSNTTLDQSIRSCMTTRFKALEELATGSVADPFWMVSGSAQYRDLKNAIAEHKKALEAVGLPIKEAHLDKLDFSLGYLAMSSRNYLQHKDPSITDEMTFEEYMSGAGRNQNLSQREQARLQAAFQARDLARDTRGVIAVELDIQNKYRQANPVDQTFYQALLRKNEELEWAMNRKMRGPDGAAVEEKVNQLLMDNNFQRSNVNPDPNDEIVTLLWEMRKMSEIIGETEALLGLNHFDRVVDPQEAARVKNSRAFAQKDVSQLPVDVLERMVAAQIENAIKAQPELQMQLQPKENSTYRAGQFFVNQERPWELNYDAKGSEFVNDSTLFESEIVRSNSSKEVQNYIKGHPKMRSAVKNHLEHRVKCLEIIEDMEENTTYRPPVTSYTVYVDGEKVDKKPEIGDVIMLEGVHERRSQSTWNGCWSVSLVSQLEYRGVKVPQEVVRNYRPGEEEGDVDAIEYYKDRKQAVSSFSGLMARMMPNAIMTQTVLAPINGLDRNKELLRHIIFDALTKHNSPVSLSAGGHYITVVGLGKDCVYVKNPMHFFGSDPEKVEMWTFDDLFKKGRGSIELNWFRDVKPTLGGSMEGDPEWNNDGIYYGKGLAHSNARDEINNPIQPHERVVQSKTVTRVNSEKFEDLAYQACLFKPSKLRYKRIPGSQYNADAMEEMMDKLLEYYTDKDLLIPGEVKAVLQDASELCSGNYKGNPDEAMLNLAGKYLDAMDKMKQQYPGLADPEKEQPKENVKNLYNTLTEQLSQIRKAVMDMQMADYKLKIGIKDAEMTYGIEEKRNERFLNATQYKERRALYFAFREGLAGALYYHAADSFKLEDRQWIQYMKPDTAKNEIRKIEQGEALGAMLTDMYDLAKKVAYYTGSAYYQYKAFLLNGLGQEAYDQYGQRVTTFNKYDSLKNATKEELAERLDALENEKEQVFKDGNLNPEHYEKMLPKFSTQRMQNRIRLEHFEKVRLDVRSGNTEGVYNRYLQYVNKVVEKNAQPPQNKENENKKINEMSNREAAKGAGISNG